MFRLYILSIALLFYSCSVIKNQIVKKELSKVGESKINSSVKKEKSSKVDLRDFCMSSLSSLPGSHNLENLDKVCSHILHKDKCVSTKGIPIFHYEKEGVNSHRAKILAFGTIHGDEAASGAIIKAWMERLVKLNPRSTWRLVPILNPDGRKLNTRMNYNKVDINRNFPTKNWIIESKEYWEKQVKKNPRRYPGPTPGSEVETQCAISHINEFQPDLIISIHTPLGVLDFDGPRLDFPNYNLLPWKRLGHFPGSLGRYMWRDHKIPVLTIELKGNNPIKNLKAIDNLQDISGVVALMTKWNN